MTILDACIHVLKKSPRAMTADEIYDQIQLLGLYEFKAENPRSIVRGTLRKHLRAPHPHRIRQVDSQRFEAL